MPKDFSIRNNTILLLARDLIQIPDHHIDIVRPNSLHFIHMS